jgi:hypothetical protein
MKCFFFSYNVREPFTLFVSVKSYVREPCLVKNVENLQIEGLAVGKAPTQDNHSDRVRHANFYNKCDNILVQQMGRKYTFPQSIFLEKSDNYLCNYFSYILLYSAKT